MLPWTYISALAAATLAAAQKPDEDGRYTISSDGIKAQVGGENLLETYGV
jgi:nucleoside-diphosphate-sugar epimerase